MIIEKCTDINPKKRFKNITSLRGVLLKIFAEPQTLTPSLTATEWVEKLQNHSNWDSQQFGDFARFMKTAEDASILWIVCQAIDEDVLRSLHSIDEGFWQIVALAYCDWAYGTFGFDYCDVIIKRLEVIFELGNPISKSSAALASAVLGSSHNRWFVMSLVMRMMGSNLDDLIARRIAIEISVEGVYEQLINCAERISRSVNDYHPRITEVLLEYQSQF